MNRIDNYKPLTDWRDITPKEAQKELLTKIACATGGVILLIGTAVALYFICTSGLKDSGRVPLVGMSYIAGTGLAMICLFQAAHLDDEKDGHSSVDNLSDPLVRAERRDLLKKQELHAVYNFVRSNGGIGPIVRHGIVAEEKKTAEELGKEMSAIFRAYKEPVEILAKYSATKVDKEHIPEYKDAHEQVVQLQQRWEQLRERFTSHEPLTAAPSEGTPKKGSRYPDLLPVGKLVADEILLQAMGGKVPPQDPNDLVKLTEQERILASLQVPQNPL